MPPGTPPSRPTNLPVDGAPREGPTSVTPERVRALLDMHEAAGGGRRSLASYLGHADAPSLSGIAYASAAVAEAPDLAAAYLASEEARVRAERRLACERGEWAPEGWEPRFRGDAVRWVRTGSQRPGRTCDVACHGRNGGGVMEWHWWDRHMDRDGDETATHHEGRAPYALDAIEAADAALGGDRG